MNSFWRFLYVSFSSLANRYKKRSGERGYDLAFLIHPRTNRDVTRNFPFLAFFPNFFIELLLLRMWPMCIGKMNVDLGKNKYLRGIIISCPMTAKQIMKNKSRAKKQVLKALLLAEHMGAKIAGLGALTAPAVGGGGRRAP